MPYANIKGEIFLESDDPKLIQEVHDKLLHALDGITEVTWFEELSVGG